MSLYKISNDELIDFARKIYEEACGGYLDLKDSVCSKLVRDFIDGRQIFEGITDTQIAEAYQGYQGYQGHPGPEGYAGPENDAVTWTYNTSTDSVMMQNSGHTISLRDEPNVLPRVEDAVRPDQNEINLLRDYRDYEGNESERF